MSKTDEAWKRPMTNSITVSADAPIVSGTILKTSEKLKSEEILEQANRIIHGERAQSYGRAEDSFARIGDYWTTFLADRLKPGEGIDAYDVAMLMTLMKVARAHTDVKDDTFVDIAGYAALAPRCAAHAGRITS